MAIDTPRPTYTRDDYKAAVEWLLANAKEDPFLLSQVQFLSTAKFLTPKQVTMIQGKMHDSVEDEAFAARAAALLS